MRKCAVGIVCGLALAGTQGAFADDWPGPGKYVAKDASAFVNPDDPSVPFTMGEGMLLYTGSSTLTDVVLTFNMAGHDSSYVGVNTINVQDPEATLTLAGKINHTQGCFYKAGPGTLSLTYPGYQQLAPGPSGGDVKQGSDPAWNEETGACTTGFTTFTLGEGTIIMGTPGQTNYVSGMTLIGNRNQANVRLAVTNGVFRQANNWLCISRGTGQTSNECGAELYVGKDGRVECGEINIANSLGKPNPYPRGRIFIDGGVMTSSARFFCNEGGNGMSEFFVKDGGSFRNTCYSSEDAGWRMQCSEGGVSTTRVENASFAATRYFSMRMGSVLTVNGGSKFLFDRTSPKECSPAVNQENGGIVALDGATLGTEYALAANWFSNLRISDCRFRTNSFTVAANGLTIDVPAGANGSLFPPISTASGVTAANVKITKQGAGTASIVLPAENQIEVKEGNLALRNWLPNTAKVPSQTPVVAAGSKLIAAGEEAFANLTIPAGTPVVLRAQGLEMENGGNWACTGWATMRSDGLISLGSPCASANGGVFLNKKVDVSKSFRLTFDVAMRTRSGWGAGGIAACFTAQTKIRGGTSYSDIGYRNGAFTNASHRSVALLVDIGSKNLRFGQNGLFSGECIPMGMWDEQMAAPIEAPHRATIDYDATAGKVTFTLAFRTGVTKVLTREVNLAEALGTTTPYLAFTGATDASNPVEFLVSNVAFADQAAAVAMRAGGNVTASADTPLTAEVRADAGDPAIMMKKLTFTDGAVLDIGSSAIGGLGEFGDFTTLENHDDWVLYGGAHWMENGGVGLSTAVYDDKGSFVTKAGSAYSQKPILVDRDWTIDFDFAFGKKGGGVKADCVTLSFCNRRGEVSEKAYGGFTIDCRYYLSGVIPAGKGGTYTTRLYFYKNGAEVRESDWVYDCAPVCYCDTESGHFTIAYSKGGKKLTITISDRNGSYTKELTDFDLSEMLDGTETAFLRFEGAVGGSWTENIVSNLKVAAAPDRTVAAGGALGFDTWNGSGTVVKRGSGSLAMVTNNARNVSVKVEEGGLFLAKEAVNDFYDAGRGGWMRADANIADGRRGGARVGYYHPSNGDASAVHLARKLPFGRSWTFSGDMYGMGWQTWGTGYGGRLGDGISIFVHNHPNGTAYCGWSGMNAGFCSGTMNAGWALTFRTYDGEPMNMWGSAVGTASSAATGPNYIGSYADSGFRFNHDQTTHFDITYDAVAKKATFTMTGGGKTFSNTVEDLDLKSILGGEYGYLGFGSGGGGAHGILDWTDVRVTFADGADEGADLAFLKNVEITAAKAPVRIDSRRANGVFRLAPTVKVAAGSVLLAQSATLPATLTMGTLELGEGAVVGGDANTVVKPDAVVGANTLRVEGTTLALATKAALAGVRDIYLTGGAKLRLDFEGTLLIRRVYVDGVRQKADSYGAGGKAAAWIDPASTGTLAIGSGFILMVK